MEAEISARSYAVERAKAADVRWLEADERASELQAKLDDLWYEAKNEDERR